jgi:MYXO-CTERM domain-containing protein
VFTAIPEPSSFGFVAGLAALGGGLLRRRRQSQS